MDPYLLLALLSGGLIGLLLGATGGGGSLVAIPLLVYLVGIPVQKASAMSLIVVGYSALFGAWQENRQKRVHVPAALVFSLTGMLGAWIGAQGHRLVSETIVLFLFGNLLMFMSVWTFWQPHNDQGNDAATGCANHPGQTEYKGSRDVHPFLPAFLPCAKKRGIADDDQRHSSGMLHGDAHHIHQ